MTMPATPLIFDEEFIPIENETYSLMGEVIQGPMVIYGDQPEYEYLLALSANKTITLKTKVNELVKTRCLWNFILIKRATVKFGPNGPIAEIDVSSKDNVLNIIEIADWKIFEVREWL